MPWRSCTGAPPPSSFACSLRYDSIVQSYKKSGGYSCRLRVNLYIYRVVCVLMRGWVHYVRALTLGVGMIAFEPLSPALGSEKFEARLWSENAAFSFSFLSALVVEAAGQNKGSSSSGSSSSMPGVDTKEPVRA